MLGSGQQAMDTSRADFCDECLSTHASKHRLPCRPSLAEMGSARKAQKTHRIELCVQQLSVIDESLDGSWGRGQEVQEVGVLLSQVGHKAADLHAQTQSSANGLLLYSIE